MSDRDLETALAESMRDAGISPYHRGTEAEGLAAAAILTGLAARDWRLVPSAQQMGHIFRDINPEAACPSDGFPSWAHDPAQAVLYSRRLAAQPSAEPGLREALARIEQDAGWLHDHVPDYSPDGVATLRDITRAIAQTAYQARAALTPDADSNTLAEARDEAAYWRRQAIGAEGRAT